jgi:integrase
MPRFTDRLLKSLGIESHRKDRLVFDTDCPGLGVRLTSKGTRSFLVQWTDPVTRRKLRESLGVWGNITIEQARKAARARLGEVAKGVDVVGDRQRRRAASERERAETALTLAVLISQWAKFHLVHRRPRYAAEAQRAIRHAFAQHLERPAGQLSRSDAVSVLDAMADRGKAISAGRTMAYARACYSWAEKRGKVSSNPFRNIPVSAVGSERDRVLTDVELRQIWRTAATIPYPFGPFFQLAILTLQRREEVARMRWSEISDDRGLWTIPGTRMKNGKPHDVHLSEPAQNLLSTLPRINGSDLVFTTTGTTPISGFSKAKRDLDTAIARRINELKPVCPAPGPWRLHDLRRSGVTKLAALGFDSIVADKLLAHKPAKLRGVAAVYQRYDFAQERARALDAWAAHVVGAERASNVVELHRAV